MLRKTQTVNVFARFIAAAYVYLQISVVNAPAMAITYGVNKLLEILPRFAFLEPAVTRLHKAGKGEGRLISYGSKNCKQLLLRQWRWHSQFCRTIHPRWQIQVQCIFSSYFPIPVYFKEKPIVKLNGLVPRYTTVDKSFVIWMFIFVC